MNYITAAKNANKTLVFKWVKGKMNGLELDGHPEKQWNFQQVLEEKIGFCFIQMGLISHIFQAFGFCMNFISTNKNKLFGSSESKQLLSLVLISARCPQMGTELIIYWPFIDHLLIIPSCWCWGAFLRPGRCWLIPRKVAEGFPQELHTSHIH